MSTLTTTRPAPRLAATGARPAKTSTLAKSIDPIRVLRRHALGIIAAAVLGGMVGIVSYLVLSRTYPLYRERVLFEVQPGLQQAGQVGVSDQGDDNTIFRLAQTETFMLTHPVVLEQALKNPDIKLTDWHRRFMDPSGVFLADQALDELIESVSTNVVRGSNLFSVSWAANRDADVPIVLNAIARAYLNEREDRDKRVYGKNLTEFKRQLETTEVTLDDLTREMQKLIKESGITTLDDVRFSGTAVKREELTKQLASLTGELSLASTNYNLTSAKLQGTIEPSASDYFEAERDEALGEQIILIQRAKTHHRELLQSRAVPNDPMVLKAESTIRAMEEERDVKLKEMVNRNLQAKLMYFADDIEKAQKAIEEMEKEIEKTDRLLEDLAAKQAQYDALRMRREHLEARRTADLKLIGEVELIRVRADAARVRQVQPALTPRERAFPKIQVIVPLGVLLFVGVTVGFVFLREFLDQRIKSVSDLAVLPGAQVLGGIPDLLDDPTKTSAAELVVRKHPNSVLAESYRQAATALLPMMDHNGHQTLLMVGVLPGAGTTTVVTNMAAAAAASGRRVLVVDANFRRPRLADAMGLSDEAPGLADLLNGSATLEQAIGDAGDGISVISAGTPSNRVFDRLNNGSFESLVAELRGRFDVIIFDAPPVIVAGDAMVLANKVDAAVLVVRAHQEHRGLVARMLSRLADARCETLGVLLNRPRGISGGYLKKNYATMAKYSANA